MRRAAGALTPALMMICLASPVLAQGDLDRVEITTTQVADGIYMLAGAGGNIGVSVGADGAFLIDDQYAPLTEKILTAVGKISDGQVHFLLNTHWHRDHTGGNENAGKMGIVVVAHDNVRERMSVPQFNETFDSRTPAASPGALPVVTFNDSVTFHLNGDEIHAFHVGSAHTDGDTIVHFRKANVFHMGDVLFNRMYPFIDGSSGGSIDGVLAAVANVLSLSDEQTRFIAGHGPVADRKDLEAYQAMLRTVRAEIAPMIAAGKTLQQIQDAEPTAQFDDVWGGGFLDPDKFVELTYGLLTTAP